MDENAPGFWLVSLTLLLFTGCWQSSASAALQGSDDSTGKSSTIRAATFNVSLNRKTEGALAVDLASGKSIQAQKIAEIIQRVRPDLILLNEFDYDIENKSIELFRKKYLEVPQNDQYKIEYPYFYSGPVNTGVDSGLDLNNNGKTGDPDDAWGFGAFPGQYGMVVLSKYPIDSDGVRTFQKFQWHMMPNALRPADPDTHERWYSEETWNQLRLSSKSHWDVPIQINGSTIHFLCAHPTPPVFDGPEDRNGRRNHDEIRLLADYLVDDSFYIIDNRGIVGGLESNALAIVAGDMNADPMDGDSYNQAARQLTTHPRLIHSPTPSSRGAVEAAGKDGMANMRQSGEPAFDTGDFNDQSVGNVRVDYCLPTKGMTLVDCGVFWPASDEEGFHLNDVSDHHLVWIDLMIEKR